MISGEFVDLDEINLINEVDLFEVVDFHLSLNDGIYYYIALANILVG